MGINIPVRHRFPLKSSLNLLKLRSLEALKDVHELGQINRSGGIGIGMPRGVDVNWITGWRSWTVDGVPSHSSEDSIAEASSWGRGTGRRGPSRGATERRIVPGHKWNVSIIGGYGVETKNGIFQDLEHYKGKTLEDVVTSVPDGVDPSDWWTMCEEWNTREEQDIAERNRQNRTHQSMTYRWGPINLEMKS
ncbi:hypothetical protein Taro_056642, partial [Colocasia esculenta]|nr:hypothetical protein [Colocasia esculenta]